MERRVDHLVEEGLARRQGQRVIFARDLLDSLHRRELDDAIAKLSAETGLAHHPSAEGEYVSGACRQRVTLASGRFAMIDDGLGFQLVPWRPGTRTEARPACSGHDDAGRRRRVELRAQTGAWTVAPPDVPQAQIAGAQPS